MSDTTMIPKNTNLITPLNAELNPIFKFQFTELFCGVFQFCACFLKNVNILRTKWDKFVKQKAVCGEDNRYCSECFNTVVKASLFAWRTDEKMSYKLFFCGNWQNEFGPHKV
jgi:hypothetical protein